MMADKKTLLVATHNEHKKEEIQQILGENFEVKSLRDVGLTEEIAEDGNSFEENAAIKAKYCFDKTGISSLGDDSGLVVPALDGRPGIYSARYSGDHDFNRNIARVLEEMQDIDSREAYFITVLCFYNESGPHYYQGRVYGNLTREVHGKDGFGYDPIFIPEGFNETFAEMSAEDKNQISHRKKALDLFLSSHSFSI